jgi:hypothetical protein
MAGKRGGLVVSASEQAANRGSTLLEFFEYYLGASSNNTISKST